MYKPQRIRDPIHNIISFQANEFESAMWGILQTRPFQRLRRVKQLGFSDFVYPGATHSRFAHSVGVFHTARQLVGVIRNRGEEMFQPRRAEAALAAALVHDVGHGPFSHAFEDVGRRLGLKLADHEVVSQQLIRDSELSEALQKLGGGFHNDVADIIESPSPRNIYDAIVSSQFDADRLDYMRRDRTMAGSSHGAIDYDWLIANLEVGVVHLGVDEKEFGEVETFVIGSKAISAAETYILGLFQLYPAIYFHKTTRGAEKIFSQLMVRILQLCIDGSWRKTGLPNNHPIVQFALSPDNIECALALDDTVIWGALSLLIASDDTQIAELASRLLNRKLMRCFDVRAEIKKCLRDNLTSEEVEELTNRSAAKILEKAEIWRKSRQDQVFLDEYTRSPYKKINESKGPLNQIRVKVAGGRTLDLSEISPVVKAIRPYKLFRYYIDRDDGESVKALSKIVKEQTQHG